jgi:hypothetical protein
VRPTGKTSLHFLMGCMDFCWLFAWARFTTSSLIPGPLPLPESILAFTLGGVLAYALKGRGWPVISILGLHLLLIMAASGLMLRAALTPHCAPWDVMAWLRALGDLAPPFGWVRISVVWLWGVCLWVEGVRLVRCPGDADTFSARFDLGLAALFALLLVQSFISLQLGVATNGGGTRTLMLSFLAFGLLGIGLSRSRTLTRKHYRTGFRAAGVLLTFSAVALFLGTGLVSLFFPYLTEAARMGYAEMKAAAGHAEPYLIAILRFMFRPRGGSPTGEGAAAGGTVSETFAPLQYSHWVERIVTVMGWGLLGLLGLAALIVAVVALWYFVGWLFSRTTRVTDDEPVEWRTPLWSILRRFLKVIHFGQRGGMWGPIELFSFLVAWGNRSGHPHRSYETPCEYGARLNLCFPRFKRDFERIIELLNRRVYGEMDPRPGQLRDGQAARRRLSNPLFWPTRLRSRLSGPRG